MTFEDEITAALQALRHQHAIETNAAERLEHYMIAHHQELRERMQGIRQREVLRRADLGREIVTLASEVGLLPRVPPPMPVATHCDPLPRFINRHAGEEAERAVA